MTKSLLNKTAIVTGAGRGIGAACVQLFAREGARIVLVSRTQEEIESVEQEISQRCDAKSLSVVADVSKEEDVVRLFKLAKEKFGPVDILVNNAAIIKVEEFTVVSVEDWDETMAVNLRGPFLCSREAFIQMRENGGGSIVNVSSLAGIKGTEKFKGFCSYVVSKHGVVGLTESLAVEGRDFGIRVNCIAPGAVNTRMLKEAAPFLSTQTQPEDIAKAILFLCDGNCSAKITGAVVEIHSNE